VKEAGVADTDGINGTTLNDGNVWTFDSKQWVLFSPNNNANDKDLWPGWYVETRVNDLIAPFGQQTKQIGTDRTDFRQTLICGNENRDTVEGEKAYAWHIQTIDEVSLEFGGLSVTPSTFAHKEITTITATFSLLDTHGLCKNCWVYFKYSSKFTPCSITMNGATCTYSSGW
jgi:hypothetical protein